jgi:hypothetical protein
MGRDENLQISLAKGTLNGKVLAHNLRKGQPPPLRVLFLRSEI